MATRSHIPWWVGCGLAVFLHAPDVSAADSDAQIAQSLFDEGRIAV